MTTNLVPTSYDVRDGNGVLLGTVTRVAADILRGAGNGWQATRVEANGAAKVAMAPLATPEAASAALVARVYRGHGVA